MAKRRSTEDTAALSRRRESVDEPQLFDLHPLNLGGFKLTSRRAEPIGRPTLEQFAGALQFAVAAENCSPYWIGDLWNYGEGRQDWRDRMDQAIKDLGSPFTHKTLMNMGYISRKVQGRARELAPTIGHASEVAALEPDEQVEWMDRAKTEGMSVRDLRLEVKASRRRKVIEGQAVLSGMFRVIYADPPWPYGDRPPSGSGAEQHYTTMTIDDICRLPVEAHAEQNSVLFLWVPVPLTFENPGPREVIEAWGFKAKTGRCWDKVLHGFGHYVDVRHENLWICTRGSCLPDRPTPMLPSVVVERRSPIHSEKPESFRRDIERLYDGPYLELFGRKPVEGWTVFGNDARLWSQEATAQAS